MEEYWDRFVRTGKIMDYLNYKGIAVCKYRDPLEKGNADPGAADCDKGEALGESDYTDRHGACGGAYW